MKGGQDLAKPYMDQEGSFTSPPSYSLSKYGVRGIKKPLCFVWARSTVAEAGTPSMAEVAESPYVHFLMHFVAVGFAPQKAGKRDISHEEVEPARKSSACRSDQKI